MAIWDFMLTVEGRDLSRQDVFDALCEAGCEDALIGVSNGVQYLDFDRESPTLEEAVASAVRDVERVPRLHVVRLVDSDLVSMAEIAERTGRTRESIRLLVSGERGPGSFPPPVTNPSRPHRLWHWSEVKRWLECYKDANSTLPRSDAETLRSALSAGVAYRWHSRGLSEEQRRRMHEITHI